jgi:hypothetical protein
MKAKSMSIEDWRTNIVELASHVAQQIQKGIPPDNSHMNFILQFYRRGNAEAHLLQDLMDTFNIYYEA